LSTHLAGFRGEYLSEFDLAEQQLLALAEAFPAERYGWRTAETARSVSEVLVHVAAGGLTLLALLGVEAAPDLYGKPEGEYVARIMAMVARNESLEKSITDKTAVLAFLRRSLPAWRKAFAEASDAELDRRRCFSESAARYAGFTCEDYATCTSTWDSSSHTPARWACPRHGGVSAKLAGRPLRISWRPQRNERSLIGVTSPLHSLTERAAHNNGSGPQTSFWEITPDKLCRMRLNNGYPN